MRLHATWQTSAVRVSIGRLRSTVGLSSIDTPMASRNELADGLAAPIRRQSRHPRGTAHQSGRPDDVRPERPTGLPKGRWPRCRRFKPRGSGVRPRRMSGRINQTSALSHIHPSPRMETEGCHNRSEPPIEPPASHCRGRRAHAASRSTRTRRHRRLDASCPLVESTQPRGCRRRDQVG